MPARRILVIDDADDVRNVTQLSLERMGGWTVSTARSGAAGVEKAIAEQPEAILLDVMMPDMDGPTTFQQLQANATTRHIPVIFLTGMMQSADQRRFAALGVTACIAKPFSPLTLASQVAAALGWEL
ncbi:MAG TPA: response regulator [Candidatus Tectomicrobia bacterium]